MQSWPKRVNTRGIFLLTGQSQENCARSARECEDNYPADQPTAQSGPFRRDFSGQAEPVLRQQFR